MKVTVRKRTYIPENAQQCMCNSVVELLIMRGNTIVDGCEFPAKKARQADKFIKDLCEQRGWQIV